MANVKSSTPTFSQVVRQEACEFISDSPRMGMQELAGFVYGCISMDMQGETLRLKTTKRGEYVQDRVLSNLKAYFLENGIEQQLDNQSSCLAFTGVLAELLYAELTQLPQQKEDDMCRALLRGLFIGGGTISSPENQHYFDISSTEKAPLVYVQRFLETYQIKASIIPRKNRYILYVKSGDAIADILKLLGTPKAALYYEEALCASIAANLSNRAYNCYSANVNKFITRKLRIKDMILSVDPHGKMGFVTEDLRRVVEILMDEENEVFSLTELGSRLNPPIGKSGVAHRLDRLEKLLNEIITKYK